MAVTDELLNGIPGWFDEIDRTLFRITLAKSREITGPGDLAELGVFMGKSAALVGDYVGGSEKFTVIDLFESAARDDENVREQKVQYPDLSREVFETNYLLAHSRLPVVVQDFSDRILDHVSPGSCRFVHVDASHLFEHVVADVASAKQMLCTDGLVVFDDYRSAHTPGVAAAVWGEVATGDLRTIALSHNKMYATWGDPQPWRDAIGCSGASFTSETQTVAGEDILLLSPSERDDYRWVKYLPPASVPAAKRARAGLAKTFGPVVGRKLGIGTTDYNRGSVSR